MVKRSILLPKVIEVIQYQLEVGDRTGNKQGVSTGSYVKKWLGVVPLLTDRCETIHPLIGTRCRRLTGYSNRHETPAPTATALQNSRQATPSGHQETLVHSLFNCPVGRSARAFNTGCRRTHLTLNEG